MKLDENSPVGFVPVWKENPETKKWEPTNQPLQIDRYVFWNLHNALLSKKWYNQDFVMCFDGDEGSGKSQGMTQIGAVCAAIMSKKLRRKVPFTEKNITYSSQELMNMALDLPDWTPIAIDETKEIANRKRSMGKEIVKLENFLSECRLKHKIILVVVPKIQDLTAYLSEHRIKALFHFKHVFDKVSKHERPGFYFFHGKKNCQKIGLSIRKGQRNWYPASAFPMCRSMNAACVDMGALDNRKDNNLDRYRSEDTYARTPSDFKKVFVKEVIKRMMAAEPPLKVTNETVFTLIDISKPTYYAYRKEIEEEQGLSEK